MCLVGPLVQASERLQRREYPLGCLFAPQRERVHTKQHEEHGKQAEPEPTARDPHPTSFSHTAWQPLTAMMPYR